MQNQSTPESTAAPADAAASAAGCGCAPTCCPGGARQPSGTPAGAKAETGERGASGRIG